MHHAVIDDDGYVINTVVSSDEFAAEQGWIEGGSRGDRWHGSGWEYKCGPVTFTASAELTITPSE